VRLKKEIFNISQYCR